MSLRKLLLFVWFTCVFSSGALTSAVTGSIELGVAVSLAIVGVSIGVPLMRAFTEFSK